MSDLIKCPLCGRKRWEDCEPEETPCSPTNCEAWQTVAQFDHATRQWVHPKVHERLQQVRIEGGRG